MNKKKKLSVEITREIAELARIRLAEGEEEKFTTQLNNILDYFEKLSELNTDGVEPRTHPTDLVNNNLREDVVKPSLSNKEALKNAKKKEKGFFKAPRII